MQARKPLLPVLSKKRGAYPQSNVVFDSNGGNAHPHVFQGVAGRSFSDFAV